MKTEQRTENELIAEFMGYTQSDGENGVYHKGQWYNPQTFDFWEMNTPLQYNSSWDWLMLVIEKIGEPEVNDGKIIRSAADIQIMYKACRIEYTPDEDFEDRDEIEIQTQGETKIEAVYKSVIEFITWYNSSNRQEK